MHAPFIRALSRSADLLARNPRTRAAQRLEPIGQDSKKNTYWLIGGDRLWVQHPDPNPPPPPRKRQRRVADAASSSKAATHKSGAKTSGSKRGAAKLSDTGRGRGRPPKTSKNTASDKKSKLSTRPRGRPRSSPAGEALVTATRTRSGGRQARATSARPMRSAAVTAKANMRKRPLPTEYFEDDFDEDQDISEEQSLTRSSKRPRTGTSTPLSSSVPPATRATRSTRNSRLRNRNEDEWQQIPDEWLNSDSGAPHAGDRDDGELTAADVSADDNAENLADGGSTDGQRRATARSHPRRIVSPSSSPDPASNLVAAPLAAKKIFGDDDSDLTDLTEDDGGSKRATLDADAERNDLDGSSREGKPGDAGETLEEDGEDDLERDGESDGEDDEVVDEEYAIRIAASQPKEWVEWETVRSFPIHHIIYNAHAPLRYVSHSRNGRPSQNNSKTAQA